MLMLFAIISYLLDNEVNAATAVLCICYYGRCHVHADIVSWLVCSSVFAVHFFAGPVAAEKNKIQNLPAYGSFIHFSHGYQL